MSQEVLVNHNPAAQRQRLQFVHRCDDFSGEQLRPFSSKIITIFSEGDAEFSRILGLEAGIGADASLALGIVSKPLLDLSHCASFGFVAVNLFIHKKYTVYFQAKMWCDPTAKVCFVLWDEQICLPYSLKTLHMLNNEHSFRDANVYLQLKGRRRKATRPPGTQTPTTPQVTLAPITPKM